MKKFQIAGFSVCYDLEEIVTERIKNYFMNE